MGRKHCGKKGEIARYKQFLLLPQCFLKICTETPENEGLFGKGLGCLPACHITWSLVILPHVDLHVIENRYKLHIPEIFEGYLSIIALN